MFDENRAQLYTLFLTVLGDTKMKKLLVLALLAGCSSAMKHETVTLQCLGFCAYTDINHYSKESKK